MRPDTDYANKKKKAAIHERNSHGSAAFLFEAVMITADFLLMLFQLMS